LTVSTTSTKVQYDGNGVATEFSFSPIPILASENLVVILTEIDTGVETTLSEGTGPNAYSVSVAAYPGTGSITYPEDEIAPMEDTHRLTIKRVLDLTQPTVLDNDGNYYPKVQERSYDRLCMQIQQLQEQLNRAITMPDSTTEDPMTTAELQELIEDALEQLQDLIQDGAVPTSRTISTTSPITGGGDLSANRTIAHANSGVTPGTYKNVTVNATGHVTAGNNSGGDGSLPWFDVTSYGAVGDHTTDDTQAFTDAKTALLAAGRGVLYVPAGTYRVTNRTCTTYSGVPMAFMGDGQGVSIVTWDVSSGGFKWTGTQSVPGSNDYDQITVVGLTLLTTAAGGGTALELNGVSDGVDIVRQYSLRDLEIRGYDHGGTHTDYWTRGIYISEPHGLAMVNVAIPGTHSASQTSSSAKAIELNASTGGVKVSLRSDLVNVDVNLYYYGLILSGRMEGIHITNSEFAECYYAMDCVGDATNFIYGVFFSNSHLSGYVHALRTTSTYSMNFSNSLIIRAAPPGGGAASNSNTIDITSTYRSTFSGCTIHGTASLGGLAAASEAALVLKGTGTGVSISGNTFFGVVGDAVRVESANVTKVRISGNTYDAVSGNHFYTEGADCWDLDTFRGAWTTKTADQSIANNTLTAVTWAETQLNTESNVSGQTIWSSGSNTRLTVPTGVTKIVLRGNVQFAHAGSPSDLGVTFRKNGTDYTYAGRPASSGSSASGGDQQGLISPVLTVTAGDYFEMMVIQISGGSLNVQYQDTASPGGGKQTWAQMEIVK
jgi:hypothetical protein